MTQEEKLEEAKRLYETANADQRYVLESLFPELKESEDERIRKEILEYFQQFENEELRGVNISDWIAWLEKQSEQKSYGQREECIDCQFNYAGECKGSCTMKRSERKPADKVKPKFKISNWIINRTGATIMQIVNNEDFYESVEIGGQRRTDTYNYVERDFRLWSIEDAKDGDVLIDKSGSREGPFIFKETKPSDIKTNMLNPLTVLGYCGIGGAGFTKGIGWGDTANCIYYPATKEQRELLFKRMHEAGYEWNADKKELKKINSYCQEHCKGYQETGKCFVDGGCNAKREAEKIENTSPLLSDFFNAEYERGKADALKCAEWSEEDERMCQNMLECLRNGWRKLPADILKYESWLKSLKPQKQWKPSKEQMEALKASYLYWNGITKEIPYAERLESLYEQLKKLTE